MTEVFQDQRLGVAGEAFEVVRKGFFPKDGEEVNFFLKPVKQLKSITMTDLGVVECGVRRRLEFHSWQPPAEGC